MTHIGVLNFPGDKFISAGRLWLRTRRARPKSRCFG